MTPLLTHHTPGLCGYSRPDRARSSFWTLVPLFPDLRRAAKEITRNRSIIPKMRREAGAPCALGAPKTLQRVKAAPTQAPLNRSLSRVASAAVVIFRNLGPSCHDDRGPARAGTPPDASGRWTPQLQSITAGMRKVSAYLRWSAGPLPAAATGKRQLRIGKVLSSSRSLLLSALPVP